MKSCSKTKKTCSLDRLDSCFALNCEMIESNGEDNFFYSLNELFGIVSVLDGCGGLGSVKYPGFKLKTGAYIASRVGAIALKEWFNYVCDNITNIKDIDVLQLKNIIDNTMQTLSKDQKPAIKIKGSMTKTFPTTLAAALIAVDKKQIHVKSIWAGDSRVYVLDKKGLAQLTKDDVNGEDALSNLFGDGTLTNVVSASGNYELHQQDITFEYPCTVFAATDGCFGYIPTPMQFEYIMLLSLKEADCFEQWKENIQNNLKPISGDDYTICLSSWGFKTFDILKSYYASRTDFMFNNYILPLEDADYDAKAKLWKKYQIDYCRYLTF